MVDFDGGDRNARNDVVVADLAGVAANQLNANHFIV